MIGTELAVFDRPVVLLPWYCGDSGPLTVAQARAVMREHLECVTDPDLCRIRYTAARVLVAAGVLVPDSHRRSRIG